jgi:cytochrome c oxidase subunit 1
MSAIFGMFAGIYHWFPKMYGKMMNTKLGYAHFWITFVCAFGVFFPMHFIGLAGAPRRYYSYSEFPMFDGVVDLNVLVTVFAIIGALAQVIFTYNFFYSIPGRATRWSGPPRWSTSTGTGPAPCPWCTAGLTTTASLARRRTSCRRPYP